MNNRSTRKGFTLGELLIVVAIIGVLIAISVPIFTNQLKKARLVTNKANARQAKSAVLTTWMTSLYSKGYYNEVEQDEVYYMYDPSTGEVTNIEDVDDYKPDPIGAADWNNVENDISEWTTDTPVGNGKNTLGSKVYNNLWFLTISVASESFGQVSVYYVK